MSGSNGPLLPGPPTGPRIRRLNKVPIYVAGAVLVGWLGYNWYSSEQKKHRAETEKTEETKRVSSAGFNPDSMFPPAKPSPAKPPPETAQVVQLTPPPVDPDLERRRSAWALYEKQTEQIKEARLAAEIKALAGGTEVGQGGEPSGGGAAAPNGLAGLAALSNMNVPSLPQMPNLSGLGGGGLGGGGAGSFAGVDAAAQAAKRNFLGGNHGADVLGANEDLAASLHGPKMDTIMEGTPIPGIMIGGLTSDMPGMIIGQIPQDIYDTATSTHILIPQGTRVVGLYDNAVSYGQERVGVIWNRLIFPDASSLQIGSMEGANMGGYAGFKDQVNTHFWDKFWAAALISLAGAASQLSQTQQPVNGYYSSGQIAAASTAQGFNQLGQAYAAAGLSIPNTLEVRPGYQFNIMVAKDIHLPPYRDRRLATSRGPILQ